MFQKVSFDPSPWGYRLRRFAYLFQPNLQYLVSEEISLVWVRLLGTHVTIFFSFLKLSSTCADRGARSVLFQDGALFLVLNS